MACATSLADEVSAADPWLWPQRVALGSLTLVVGDPGVGKSYLTLDMAARVSRGASGRKKNWPLATRGRARLLRLPRERAPGSTFLLCAEDDYANTIRPQLVALGADLAQISALRDNQGDQAFDLLPCLPDFARQIQSTPNARLWIIDPISSYLGNLQENHDRSIRGLLNPLANLAVAHQLAIVMVTHLSKGDGKALHRVLGSRAFGACGPQCLARCGRRGGPSPQAAGVGEAKPDGPADRPGVHHRKRGDQWLCATPLGSRRGVR